MSIKIHTRLRWAILILSVCSFFALGWISYNNIKQKILQFEHEFQNYLSKKFNAKVEIEGLITKWHFSQPSIMLKNLIIYDAIESNKQVLNIKNLDFELSLLRSLYNFSPSFKKIDVQEGEINLNLKNGVFFVKEINQKSTESFFDSILQIISNQNNISIENFNVKLKVLDTNNPLHLDYNIKKLLYIDNQKDKDILAEIYSDKDLSSIQLVSKISENTFYNWHDGKISGNINVAVKSSESLKPVFNSFMAKHKKISLEGIQFDSKFSFEKNVNDEWQISGNLNIHNGKLINHNRALKKDLTIKKLTTDFQINLYEDVNKIWLTKTKMNINGIDTGKQNYIASLSKKKYLLGEDNQSVILKLDYVKFSTLSALLSHSNVLKTQQNLLFNINPRGTLNDIVVEFDVNNFKDSFLLNAQLKNTSIEAWEKIPHISNLTGKITATSTGGHLYFNSKGLKVAFINFFEKPMLFKKSQGVINWELSESGFDIFAEALELQNEAGKFKTNFDLFLPYKNQYNTTNKIDKLIALSIFVDSLSAVEAIHYLPQKIMDTKLINWLENSIIDGKLINSNFYLNSRIGSKNEITWQLKSQLENGALNYENDWPSLKNLSGNLSINNNLLELDLKSLKTRELTSNKVTVKLPISNKNKTNKILNIQTVMQGQANKFKDFAFNSPIKKAKPLENIHLWKPDGDVSLDLNLDLPLQKIDNFDFTATATIQNAKLELEHLKLKLNNIAGKVKLKRNTGFYDSNLTAYLFDSPINMNISTNTANKNTIKASGSIATTSIFQWLEQSKPTWINGAFDYTAELQFAKNDSMQVNIYSDLKGLSIETPKPFVKTAQQKLPAHLNFISMDDALHLKFNTEENINIILKKDKNSREFQSNIHFGNHEDNYLPTSGISVTGSYPFLDLTPWKAWFSKHIEKQTNGKFSKELPKFKMKDFFIEKLIYDQLTLQNTYVSAHTDKEIVAVLLRNDYIGEGSIFFPTSTKQLPIRVHFKKLDSSRDNLAKLGLLSPTQNNKSISSTDSSRLILKKYKEQLPMHIDIQVDELFQNSKQIGSLKTTLILNKDSINASNISASIGGFYIAGNLLWQELDKQEGISSFKGRLLSNKLNESLSWWGYGGQIDSKNADYNINITWPGTFNQFSTQNMQGSVALDIKAGRVLSKELENANILRVFGILNFETIKRRLRLDFSDLFSAGLAFDKITGKANFKNGVVTISEPITLKGPSANIMLSGTIELIKDKLDMAMIVTLPLSENIPVISLLLGQPQVAGLVYLFDKLIKQNKFSSVRYEIKGSRESPKIKLDKLFSSKVKNR